MDRKLPRLRVRSSNIGHALSFIRLRGSLKQLTQNACPTWDILKSFSKYSRKRLDVIYVNSLSFGQKIKVLRANSKLLLILNDHKYCSLAESVKGIVHDLPEVI